MSAGFESAVGVAVVDGGTLCDEFGAARDSPRPMYP
jgi:hypothetical protein